MKYIDNLDERLIHPTIPVKFLNDVLEAPRYHHLDIQKLLSRPDICVANTEKDDTRISIEIYSRILKSLVMETNDSFFGFLPTKIPPKALDVFLLGMVSCDNLNQLIEYGNNFYGLFTDQFKWSLIEHEDAIEIIIELNTFHPIDYRFIIQSLLLMFLRIFGWLAGEEIQTIGINFNFDKSSYDENLEYLFGKKINYNSKYNGVRLNRSYLDVPLSCSRDQIKNLLKRKRQLFLWSPSRLSYTYKVRQLLITHKSDKWLDIDDVSDNLNITPHLLWRKLKKEKTTFINIREQLKRDWAITLLQETNYSIAWIAERLHYSDASAFRKAFKKWTNEQPNSLRRKSQE